MNKAEFKNIAFAISTAYPNSSLFQSVESAEFWYKLLQDIDYDIAQNAVTEHISTNKFPPSIAEIREKCTKRYGKGIPDWGTAWESVLKAIRKYGWPEELKALESMDELTRKCVKRLGYQNLCGSENFMADRANFRMLYEELSSEVKTDQQLQESVLLKKQQLIAEHLEKPAVIPAKESRKEDQKNVAASHDEIDRLLSDFRQSFK